MHPDKDETDVEGANLPEAPKEKEMDFEWEEPTRTVDFISCAYNAISAMDGLDTTMLGKWADEAKRRIIRKSIKIIDRCMDDLYEELIILNEKEKEEDED